jgi:hypothetical protein
LRQRVEFVLIVCPASICLQWQREMERRFGQCFEIYDCESCCGAGKSAASESFRGPRTIASSCPITPSRGPSTASPVPVPREAPLEVPARTGRSPHGRSLGREPVRGGLRAHHLARRLAPPFEHRLFLSATPHNGHSNSFSTLLELLEPQRFTRGVPVEAGSKALEEVMVRRLERDLHDAALGRFPKRHVVRVVLRELGEGVVAQFDKGPDLPLRTLDERGLPELQLSQMLAEYSALERPKRGPGTSK